jgi:hypothetical protein
VPSVDASVRPQLGPPGDASRDEVRGGRRIRALGHCDAAREMRHDRAENGFVGERVGRGARVHVCVRVEAALVLEHTAVLDDARGGRTLVHGAREHAAVPAVHEVCVQSVTGWVAVREDEATAVVQSVESRHVEVHLVENGNEVNWVRGRAQAVVDAIRVCHVSLVIRRVKIHTVPAAREKDLSPEAVGAIGVSESWSLWCRRAIEIEANFRLEFSKLYNDRDWKLTSSKRLPGIQGCPRCFAHMGSL